MLLKKKQLPARFQCGCQPEHKDDLRGPAPLSHDSGGDDACLLRLGWYELMLQVGTVGLLHPQP